MGIIVSYKLSKKNNSIKELIDMDLRQIHHLDDMHILYLEYTSTHNKFPSQHPIFVNSTLRFSSLPSGVSFVETGYSSPNPWADKRVGSMPFPIR